MDSTQSTSRPYLSLVIPAYNEQENVEALLQRVGAALAQRSKLEMMGVGE